MNFLQKCCTAMAMALLMTGCFNKHESPEAVTMAYFRALAAEDFDAYMALGGSEDTTIDEGSKEAFKNSQAHIKSRGGISDVEIIKTKYLTEDKDLAWVYVKVKLGNGKEEETTMVVALDPDTKKWFLE